MNGSRRAFLKQMLVMAGAGVGLIATAGPAFAVQLNCCRVTSGCPICTGTKERYRCKGCDGRNFCDCYEENTHGNCFNIPCP